jgi:hypothetical protein
MREAYSLVWSVLVLLFRSRVSLEAEILILRHQLNIQRRHLPKRLAFSAMDRLIFVGLCVSFGAKYHQGADDCEAGHRHPLAPYRFQIVLALEIAPPLRPTNRAVGNSRLIRETSIANPLWGAPRIHGELLKLGIAIGQTSVAKYMVRRRGPPSQGWKIGRSAFETARSPWQNAYAERLIGSIRRECIDHVVVFGERHLRHVLLSCKDYYNATRTHLSLNKDAPVHRGVEWAGNVVCRPILGGLHHQYSRI